jgi:hypothetical protein
MMPGLNNSPTFISALADLVETAIGVNLNQRERGELVAAD